MKPSSKRWALVACVTLFLAACSGSETGPSGSASAGECARDTSPAAQGMPSEDRIFGWIEDLVGIGYRRTGTPEGRKAAAYVKCQFESLGLEDVHYETVTSWNWQFSSHGLAVNGEAVDAYPAAHSFVTTDEASTFSTGPDGLTAEIVDVGRGTAVQLAQQDVEGKILLFDLKFILPPLGFTPFIEFLWDPGLTVVEPSFFTGNPFITTYESFAEAAMEAGAAGFVGVLADYFDSNRYHNEYYRGTDVTIPGMWVSPSEGARIREMMAESESPEATLELHGSREEAEARTVIGFLPGASKDTIMVQSHHDSVFYGAVEDGSGTAAVLAQAQYFASQPAESREKTMMFATFDSHFTGYQAHKAFTYKYIINEETPYNIVANVTLEHIGKQGLIGDDGELVVTDQPEIRGVIENLAPQLKLKLIDVVRKYDLRRTALLQGHVLCPAGLMPTDAGFICAAGVPTVSLIAGPNYMYDEADTLDKVHREDLVPVTEAFAELIEAMDETPSNAIGVPIVPGLLTDILFDTLAED
ncbi:M28 family peptidase [Algiphilus aromaticivorans]|uniref:M28 family peptidase n=1 Tax=Algiphilus aromaticivorans TaxID=382454 RepID=UPI0018DDFD69|nr:M28 family peptidase [Algiphilus aromaticivorans]